MSRLPTLAAIDVGIDGYFTPSEQGDVIKGLIKWQDATHGLITFHMSTSILLRVPPGRHRIFSFRPTISCVMTAGTNFTIPAIGATDIHS